MRGESPAENFMKGEPKHFSLSMASKFLSSVLNLKIFWEEVSGADARLQPGSPPWRRMLFGLVKMGWAASAAILERLY